MIIYFYNHNAIDFTQALLAVRSAVREGHPGHMIAAMTPELVTLLDRPLSLTSFPSQGSWLAIPFSVKQ
jgi:hypothetical protein